MPKLMNRLLGRLFYGWRVLATGCCFLCFGIGGVLMRVVLFPLLNLLVWQPEPRTALARTVIRLAFRAFIGLMHGLGVLRYEIIGLPRLSRSGLLILANHPTLIDTVFLMAFVKNADCIVKGSLWNNPFTGGPVRAAGYVNNQESINLVSDCIASLARGSNLIVFPEGTRTGQSGLISLKRGAANIAVRAACDVTPVQIHCAPPTLGKGEKWWQVPAQRAYFRLEVGRDILIEPFIAGDVSDVMAVRHLTDYLQTYFNEGNRGHA